MDKPVTLIVEDDALLLGLVEVSLEDAGFAVATAQSGPEAIAKLERHAAQFQCLITDIRLGSEIDGWEVARTARRVKRTMPVIYMTGDSGANWVAQGVPGSIMLSKPFALAQLTTAVAQLTDKLPPA